MSSLEMEHRSKVESRVNLPHVCCTGDFRAKRTEHAHMLHAYWTSCVTPEGHGA